MEQRKKKLKYKMLKEKFFLSKIVFEWIQVKKVRRKITTFGINQKEMGQHMYYNLTENYKFYLVGDDK